MVQAAADRDVALEAVAAQVESTPQASRLANIVDKDEKGMMAAFRRVQILQQPGPRKREATASLGCDG